MSKRIRAEGKTYVVPDDATDDEVTGIVRGGVASDIEAHPPGIPHVAPNLGNVIQQDESRARMAGIPGAGGNPNPASDNYALSVGLPVGAVATAASAPYVLPKIAPYVAPALASYAISKARDLPLIGPVIQHIPYAEMLPWMLPSKGKPPVAEGSGPVYPGARYPEAPPVAVQQSRGLAQGGKPYADPAAGLGGLPAKVAVPEPAPIPTPQPVAARAPVNMAAESSAEFSRRTGLAEPPPVATPGQNMVPVAARASSQIRKAEQEGLAAKIEGRGAAKEALEKTPAVAQPTVAWDTGPRPVIQRGPIPGSRADRLETSILKDEVRSAAEGEERTINSQNKREWFARNQPGSSKGELTGAPEKPVKYSKTPGVSSPKPGTTVPAPDEDLTPILRKSLVAARRKRVSQ